MQEHDDRGCEPLCETPRKDRSVAALVLVMGLLFVTCFVMRVGMPELPLHVQQALFLLPS